MAGVERLLEFICKTTDNRLYQFVFCAVALQCHYTKGRLSRDLAAQLRFKISDHDELFHLSADCKSFISQNNPEIIYNNINRACSNPITFQVFVSEQGECLCFNNNGLQYFDGQPIDTNKLKNRIFHRKTVKVNIPHNLYLEVTQSITTSLRNMLFFDPQQQSQTSQVGLMRKEDEMQDKNERLERVFKTADHFSRKF